MLWMSAAVIACCCGLELGHNSISISHDIAVLFHLSLFLCFTFFPSKIFWNMKNFLNSYMI